MTSSILRKRTASTIVLLLLVQSFFIAKGQMRQVYVDNIEPDNEIYKISFYSPSSGYVAFRDWIGYTIDSGHTFTKKYITLNNVDYNGYSVNLTFGFGIAGVKAFNQTTIIVWGDYGLVPAILSSTDGGSTFKVVYHSQYSPFQFSGGITDMIFPENNNVGFAVDADRIIKTSNQGINWSTIRTDPGSNFSFLEATDNNNVFAGSRHYLSGKLLKTTNGGTSWQNVAYPITNGKMLYAYFLTPSTGWLSIQDDDNHYYLYTTSNGGSSWTLQNDPEAAPFGSDKMKFISANIGYGLSGQNTISKTTDGGKTWEPLPRNSSFVYLGYSHNDLHFINNNQLWAGGGHGFLELTTNGGGAPLPRAYFKIDTTGLNETGIVNLRNYSKTGYNYWWMVDGKNVGTTYHSTYTPAYDDLKDTVTLMILSGGYSDTVEKYVYFHPRVTVTSFTPISGKEGTEVTITGTNFNEVRSVTFGGVAAGFSVLSSTSIRARVGAGASGDVEVITATGSAKLGGFKFIPPPTITSFTPTSAAAGTQITITGTNLTDATTVTIGGVHAGYVVISPTTIKVIVPSSGSGSVTVETPGGTASLAGFVAKPTITSFTPTKGTQGTVMTITGTSLIGATTVTIGGIAALSFTINSSTSITATVGVGASGNVQVTAPGGTSAMSGFTWFPPPVITSFAPASGPVGTTVTINGSNFHAVPGSNVIYFGSMKATVVSGTTTSLTVKVPTGATFEPISVNSNNLLAYSSTPFVVTFPNGGSISDKSFANKFVLNTGPHYLPYDVKTGDLDGDGKLDVVMANYALSTIDNGITIFRNTSTTTAVSFAEPIHIPLGDPNAVALGDFDGDGKLDLAATSGTGIATFRNASTPGNISMLASVVIGNVNGPTGLAVSDVDGDGKLDIASCYYPEYVSAVFRNISEPGSLAFAPGIMLSAPGGRNIVFTDLNNDKKPDLVVPQATDSKFFVVTNNSTKGKVSFDDPVTYTAFTHSYITAGDMDGDNKTDLISGDHNGSRMVIFRNTGTGVLADPVQFDATANPTGLSVADLDGDSKLDIATNLFNAKTGIYKNLSTPGAMSLAPKLDFPIGQYQGGGMTAIGDINGDGRNDVLVSSETNRSIIIYLNDVKPEPFIQSFTPTIGETGSTITITGINFNGVTEVSFGGVPAASFTINSSTSITAVIGNGSSGEVAVTNSYGAAVKAGFSFGLPPVITSFSPLSAPAGASVTINGSGFSATAANNTVYFGGVKATVTAASPASLTVTVPVGASYRPITVTTSNLTAYSSQLFSIAFGGSTGTITSGSFAARVDRPNGGTGTFCDMDGDGKLDFIMSAGNSNIAIARNTGTAGIISFATNQVFSAGMPSPSPTITGDLDGDGRQDIVATSYDGNGIAVFRNTSSVGAISVSAVGKYLTGVSTTRPSGGSINDVDGDGRPDIIITNYYTQTVTLFRNLSTEDNIVLDTRIDYNLQGYPTFVTLRDIDGDNKPDMLVSVNPNGASVFRNTSVPGSIQFANKLDYGAGSWPNGIDAGDFDGDYKLDMAVGNINSNTLSIFRNLSTPSAISFGPNKDFASGDGPQNLVAGDLDGDGKPDLLEPNIYNGKNVSVLRNKSSIGNIDMDAKVEFAVGGDAFGATIADVDSDGVPDIAAFVGGGTTAFLRNLTGAIIPVNVCANVNSSIVSNITGATYQWQQNTGSGFVNTSDNANVSGSSTATLLLKSVPQTWNDYQFRCVINATGYSSVFRLVITGTAVTPSVSISASATTICAGASTTFTATPDNGGSNPSYQWQVNGVNAGTNSNIFSSNTLSNNSQVKVIMTSNAQCASPATATSNTLNLTVNNPVTPAVSISYTPHVICPNTAVTFTAIPSNGDSASYEWRKNGGVTGSNSITYIDNALQTGDTINVTMTTNNACATLSTVVSNAVQISVDSFVTPGLFIAGDIDVVQGQSTVLSTFAINAGANPSYQWQDSTRDHNWSNIGSPTIQSLMYEPKQTGDKVRAIMTSNANCANPTTAVSNTLVFTLLGGRSAGGLVTPNPVVSGMLVVDSLNILDGWKTLQVFDVNGMLKLELNTGLTGRSRITVPVGVLPSGMYIVVLRRENGEPLKLQFIKL